MRVSYSAPYPYITEKPVRRIDSLVEYLGRARPNFIFNRFSVVY